MVLFEVPGVVKAASLPNHVIREVVLSILAHAVDVGFIDALEGGCYQFTHDKLQAALQDLADTPTREYYHLLIGETLLAQNTDGHIYDAVVHLNAAPGFLYCPEQSIKLADMNLEASRYCQNVSAFDMAVSLLREGLALLDAIEMRWYPGLFDLSFDLTESLARMALLVGDFETCFAATNEALLHANNAETKMNIMLIQIECRMANNEMAATIEASKIALSELGVKLPRKTSMRHVVFKIMKLKFVMARKTEEDILRLPVVDAMHVTVAVRLLMNITFYALSMDEEAIGVYAALLAMDMTLQHGVSTYSAPALALFGMVVLQMGNIEWGYNLGKLALKMMEKNASRDADCPTIAFVSVGLLHWKEPLRDIRDPLVDAAISGFDREDLVYSTYCIAQVMSMEVCIGSHLRRLEELLLRQFNRIHDLGQDELLIWFRPIMQWVVNLRSASTDWRHLSQMSGVFMNFNKHTRETNAAKNILVTVTALMAKARLANAFGFHHEARDIYEELESFGHIVDSTYAFSILSWGASKYSKLRVFPDRGEAKVSAQSTEVQEPSRAKRLVGSKCLCIPESYQAQREFSATSKNPH